MRNVPGKLIVAPAILAAVLLLGSCKQPTTSAPVEDLSYASHVAFSGLHLSAEENFLGQQVVYFDGEITNQGPRVVRELKVRLFFHDVLNQVVLREEKEIVGGQDDLKPAQKRSFQIRFDETPDSWNRQVPELQISALQVQ